MTSMCSDRSHRPISRLRNLASRCIVWFAICASAVAPLVAAPAQAAQDITPSVLYQNLTELFARKSYPNTKPTALLYSSSTRQFEPEFCIFRDAEYGTEIWRLANDPDMTIPHCHINRSPWNSNGSRLCLLTYRYIPGFYYSSGDFRFLLMTADVDTVRVLVPQNNPNLVAYQRHANWDRVNPNVMWFAYFDGLYRTDVGSSDATSLFQSLPYSDRRKSIFSFLAEGNQVMVMDVNSSSYVLNLYFVDPSKPAGNRLIYYPINFGITGVGCHQTSEEWHIHDIYFRRNADTTYVMNYGPSGSVGESCFFKIPYSGSKSRIELCYPDASRGIPYYSHPAWNYNGTKVAYMGEGSYGSNDYGIHVRDHDNRIHLATLTRQVTGAHLAWDGYDDEWIFGSTGDWNGTGRPKLFKLNTVTPSCTPFVNAYTNINGTASTYCSSPRPAQSPDGTKMLYASSMLQNSDSKPETYIAVARYPYPPRNLLASGSSSVTISWQPHPISRELKGYHVYRSVDTDAAFVELTTGAVTGRNYTDNTVETGRTYYYAVTSEEHSGLESDALSEILRVSVSQSGIQWSLHRAEGLKGWDRTQPSQVGGLAMQQVASGQYRLTWLAPLDRDVRYYNIYYSVEGPPAPTPQRRIASMPGNVTTYLDWLARTDASPYYTVTAVDRAGNESAPSSVPGAPDTTPPAPTRNLDAR
ncbi:MAG: hypothetical protein V2A71_10120 [Candidatus Eisenbacteria bacterium]